MKIKFEAQIEKFEKKGEKTGWTYLNFPYEKAIKIHKSDKKSFYVKGKIDQAEIKNLAVLPMGEGDYIITLNAELRKKIGKSKGMKVVLEIEKDTSEFSPDNDFLDCLKDDLKAFNYFKELPLSHQRYFSKWIESAKTEETKARRIAKTLSALARRMNYAEMMREK